MNSGHVGGSKALIIAGVHRSGTSAVTRVCNLLGVDLGRDFMPPGADNPRGYWEHRAILRLHERALKQLGSSWDDCRALPENWQTSSLIEPFRESIRQIVKRDFSGAALWGVKDPRLCRLIPLWEDVLSLMGISVAYLIAIRNPLEVAASLGVRNGLSREKALLLWLRYSLELERQTRDCPRAFVRYEHLLNDWKAGVATVAVNLDIMWPVAPDAVAGDVDSFLTQDLRHHVATGDAGHAAKSIPELVNRTYQSLIALSENEEHGPRERLDEISDDLALTDVLYNPVLEALQVHKLELERDLERLRSNHRELKREHEHIGARIQTLQAEREQHERESANLRSECAAAKDSLNSVYASRSWRLTRPLRESARVLLYAPRTLAEGATPEPAIDCLVAPDSLPKDRAIRLYVDKASISDGRLEIEGWVFHEDCGLTTGLMTFNDASGERRVFLQLGLKRSDVHAVWDTDKALLSGFRGDTLLHGAPPKEICVEFVFAGAEPIRVRIHPEHHRAAPTDRIRVTDRVSRLLRGDRTRLRDGAPWPGEGMIGAANLSLITVENPGNDPAAHLHVDRASIVSGRLEVEGWALHEDGELTAGVMKFNDASGERRVVLHLGSRRGDIHATWGNNNALLSGFRGTALVNGTPPQVCIEFAVAGAAPLLARIQLAESAAGSEPQPAGLRTALDLLNREHQEPALLERSVDVIMPVYNGFDYLDPLFQSLSRATRSLHRLIVIDDASPDERVWPYLQRRAREHPNLLLLRNKRNKGFVASVNRAATYSAGDFVLLNTDVEVPSDWLERLMAPIQADRAIASTTPFTNAGTICSFPHMNADNPPFAGLDVERIDRWFRQVRADLPPIGLPTGIGFCMGVNGDIWRRIGSFDEKTFGRGYGEENDWCLRARAAGHFNVMVLNLFIHHKHGGSFNSANRDGLRERNLRKVLSRYPYYQHLVDTFVADDPTGLLRHIMTVLIACREAARPPVLIVDHEWGGGANAYRQRIIEKRLAADQPVLLLTARQGASLFPEAVLLRCFYRDYSVRLEVEDLSALEALFTDHLRLGEIFYNNLVISKRPLALLQTLHRLRLVTGASLTMTIHDYYPLCPSYNLLDAQGVYCRLPDIAACRKCLPGNRFAVNPEGAGIEGWRKAWGALFRIADRVLCFSEDSRRHVMRIYPECASKIEVHPHKLDVSFARQPHLNYKGPLHVGVVGAIGYAKGAKIIADLAHHMLEIDPEGQITVIGILDQAPLLPNLTVTGTYKPDELPDLLERHGINVCFLPSVWPETFSYVTAELMALNVPVAYFDIGAPAERLSDYSYGCPIPTECQVDMHRLIGCLRKATTPESFSPRSLAASES